MISVDFEKLKELYEIVNRFQGSVNENLSRAEAQASGITASGDKLLSHLNEIKRFLDDEISGYQKVERKLNEKANEITFKGKGSLNAVNIDRISERINSPSPNPYEAFFKLFVSGGDASLENRSSKVELKSEKEENLLDKSLKTVESEIKSAADMTEKTADELKNFAENIINELGKIENFIEGKVDEILGALVKELDSLENEICKALSDKNLEALGEGSLNLLKTKIAEVFVYNKDNLRAEAKYENNLEKEWNNFKSNVWNEFKKDHPEVVKKLKELKNKIETELKTAWTNFEKKYPLVAQVLKVSYKAIKGAFEGVVDLVNQVVEIPSDLKKLVCTFMEDPIGSTKKALKMVVYVHSFLNGYPPATEEEVKFRAGVVQIIRSSVDKNIIHGDAESRARFTVNVAGNLAMFVFSDGTSSMKEVGEASKVVEEVSDVEKADEAITTAEKAEGAMNAAKKAEGLMQKSGDLTEAEEKVKSVGNAAASIGKEDKVADKAVSDAGSFDKTAGAEGKYSSEGKGLDEKLDIKDVDLSKSAIIKTLKSNFNAIFDIVYETVDLGKSILFKMIDGSEQIIEKAALKASQIKDAALEFCITGCFTGDTLVLTKNGYARIDTIKVGDYVYSRASEGREEGYKEVFQVHRRNTCEFVYLNVCGEEIKTTPRHLFFKADGQWEIAGNLKAGDELVSETGENKTVISVENKLLENPEKIYNLNIKDYNTYYVSELGILVHNLGCPSVWKIIDSAAAKLPDFTVTELRALRYNLRYNVKLPRETVKELMTKIDDGSYALEKVEQDGKVLYKIKTDAGGTVWIDSASGETMKTEGVVKDWIYGGNVDEGVSNVENTVTRINKIEVDFNYNSKYDATEFAIQLSDQEAGMNKLTVDEYLKNRERYIAEGRSIEGNMAQQAARENAYLDKVTELRRSGLSPEQAKIKAQEWINTQAALHNPDQIAGGNPLNIGGIGDKAINSSIGAQWKYRIDDLDEQIQQIARNMTDTEKKSTYLNVKLTY